MDQNASLTCPDLTTINYDLEWRHLENPSNTTFSGLAQVDICRCSRRQSRPELKARWPEDKSEEPGHFYTRYQCSGPEVRFKSVDDDLWVLKSPHGPINMLQPAGQADIKRRREIHEGAEPSAYAGKNIILLTGPCPRGRYQAYATLQYLKSLDLEARRNLEYVSLLIQPYEEDWAHESAEKSYCELTEYIFQNLPNFKALHLNVWGDDKRLRHSASAFSLLLHKHDVEIVVGWSGRGEKPKYFKSARTYLEALKTKIRRERRSATVSSEVKKDWCHEDKKGSESNDSNDWEDIEEDEKDVITAGKTKRSKHCLETSHKFCFEKGAKPNTERTETISVQLPRASYEPALSLFDSSKNSKCKTVYQSTVKHNAPRNKESNSSVAKEKEAKDLHSKEQDWEHISDKTEDSTMKLTNETEYQSDEDWVDVERSPVSQNSAEERNWQVL